jgi:hypothetical protein
MPLTNGRHLPPNPHPVETVISAPEFETLAVDSSSAAPDGYAIHGRNTLDGSATERVEIRFDKTYFFGEVVEDDFPFPFATVTLDGGEKSRSAVQLEASAYKRCLQQVENHDSGLNAHFIGWIIPQVH